MKTTTKTLTAITLAAAFGGATLAGAAHAGHRDGGFDGGHGVGLLALATTETHASADADGDGTLSQAEIRKLHADLLAAHDADGDGSLSLEEFEGLWREATRTVTVRAFQSLDIDGDAIVTGAEYDRLLADRRERRDDGDDDGRGRWWGWD